jgi:GntR family transcriptional regulator
VPGEHELADEYGISRHTVREALRDLRTEGVILSARGRGSFVQAAGSTRDLGTVYQLFRHLEANGAVLSSDVLSLATTTNAAIAKRLGLPNRATLVVLRRIRRASGAPVALDASWLPAALAAPLLDVDFEHAALYDELATHLGVAVDSGAETITATVPDDVTAGQLELPNGETTLVIQRLGLSQGSPVEWRITHVRGDRFALGAQWRSGAPPPLVVTTRDPR